MITGFVLGGIIVGITYWLVHKGKINELRVTIASLQGEKNLLERQKADLESRVKDLTEQKQAETVQSKVKVAQRATLARLYEKGLRARKHYEVNEEIPDAFAKEWAAEVAHYLENTFDHSYVTQWASNEGIPSSYVLRTDIARENRKTYQYISTRLIRLNELMDSLKS